MKTKPVKATKTKAEKEIVREELQQATQEIIKVKKSSV